MLRVAAIDVGYTVRGIDDWSVDSISVVDPVLRADDEAMNALASFQDGRGEKKDGAGTSSVVPEIVIANILVKGGRVEGRWRHCPG